MLLGRVAEPFDDPRFVYEIKVDGFRCLASVDQGEVRLVSRGGHVFRGFDAVAGALPAAVRATSAVIDGELVCLDAGGRPLFRRLLARRGECFLYVFDLLAVNGVDLRRW